MADILKFPAKTKSKAGPKHPHVVVRLVGKNGNAWAIMGVVAGAMKRAGVPKSEIDEYVKESKAGDFDHLLKTVGRWVTISDEDDEEAE